MDRGAWVLYANATPWKLDSLQGIVLTSDEEEDPVRQRLRLLPEATVLQFTLSFPDMGLAVRFSNGYTLTLTPSTDPEEKTGPAPGETEEDYALYKDEVVPDWELVTPDDMLLEVGPGPVWSYHSADD